MFEKAQLPVNQAEDKGRSFVPSAAAPALVAQIERRECFVPEAVAAAAAKRPEAVAVSSASEVLTYADLERRSSQLVHYLKSVGAGPNQLIGLCMERSPSMVVAALAILKSGAAYVPLDPLLPTPRMEFMLRDAGVDILVTDSACAAKLPNGNWRLVDVDWRADEIAAFASEPFCALVSQEALAYVIYTSGSTGEPKGVEVTHGGLANLVAWHRRAFEITPDDHASHQSSPGFDAAVWEIWPYLAAGAALSIPPEACRSNPEALRDWLVARGITITFLPTPLAERMLFLRWPAETALRILLTGADTLHHRPSQELPFALINNYGPTECTVVATSGIIAPATESTELPSIGRPIDNTKVYIVDDRMQELPVGTAGELCVAGAGLARGYHKRADLTLQKFVPNPFTPRAGDRLYRTGDLARYRPDGEIEFLGRVDEQIKVRGFRVEPNEIVQALDEHAAVKASAVVARESQAGEKSLVAYVVSAAAAGVSVAALREHLAKRLPDYMVPSTFVRIESLPLTANGKVDRAALPPPSLSNRLCDDHFVAPSGVVEERLALMISSLLHVDQISANDNFFLLGGHSLLGTQLIARVHETFGVELPLLQLFDHPTLAEMSDAIERMILLKLELASAGDPRAGHADQTPA